MASQTSTHSSSTPHQDQPFPLEDLPDELLCMVYSFSTPNTIKSARLLSKRHHRCSSKYLMRRVFWALRPKTVEIFHKIVEHPVFSRSVTELVYDASFFSEDYTDDENYLELFDYQSENMWPCGTDLARLENAVKSLPNLRAVYYTNWYNMEDSLRPWYLEVGPMAWDLSSTTRLPEAHDGGLDHHAEGFVTQTLAHLLEHLLYGGATIEHVRMSLGAKTQIHLRLVIAKIDRASDEPDGCRQAAWKRFVPNLKSLIFEETRFKSVSLEGDLLVKTLTLVG